MNRVKSMSRISSEERPDLFVSRSARENPGPDQYDKTIDWTKSKQKITFGNKFKTIIN